MKSPLTCAVVGCGYIGRRHVEVLSKHPDVQLAALVDLRPHTAAEFNVPVFPELRDLLASEVRPDLVTIATPNGLHARQAIEALEHGCHVLIEKPMALRGADAEAVIRTAEAAGKQVQVVMQNRYAPAARWLKALVERGGLGRIFLVQVNLFWNRDERYYTPDSWHGDPKLDGGTLFTQFSHFVDLLYWLLGDLTNIQSRMANLHHPNLKDFEDCGLVQFDLPGGGMGTIAFTTAVWDRNAESSLTIIGEQGTVRLGGQYMDEITQSHIRDYPAKRVSSELSLLTHEYKKETPHLRVYSHLVASIRENVSSNSAQDGLKVVQLVEAMYAAARSSNLPPNPKDQYDT